MTTPDPRGPDEARDRLRRFVDRERVAARLDRLDRLDASMPSLDRQIVDRLVNRCPEVIDAILDDIEAAK